MAFDKTPTTWITGYSSDGTNITIPIASLPELTSAEAHTSTGDIRKILFALEAALYAKYAATATADRPAEWSVTRLNHTNDVTEVTERRYTHIFKTQPTAVEVVDEP